MNAEQTRNAEKAKQFTPTSVKKYSEATPAATSTVMQRSTMFTARAGIILPRTHRATLPPSSGYAGRMLIASIIAFACITVSVKA